MPYRPRIIWASLTGFAWLAAPCVAETVTLEAIRDNTLFEDATGSLSNGSGSFVFAGRSLQLAGSIRRTLVAFDIAAHVPEGATIHDVRLTLNMSRSLAGPATVGLHRLTRDWGEGASDALGQEGLGIAAAPGDATWIHTFFDTEFWTAPGGDFNMAPSATTQVDGIGSYVWGSTPGMTADVQGWLDDPSTAFGWILIGDETLQPSVKRFDSREHPTAASRPTLEIEFTRTVPPIPTLSNWGFGALLLLLVIVGAARIQTRPGRG